MENRDNLINNNLRLRHQQQMGSRADKATSWRTQRDPHLDSPSKKRRNVGDQRLEEAERLNVMYRNALHRDNRVSLWCHDVQRHNIATQPSSAFTVFRDSPLNHPSQQAVGIDVNIRDPPGLLLSPLQQSMNMPTLVSPFSTTITTTTSAAAAMNFTSAHLRSPELSNHHFPQSAPIGFGNQFPGVHLDMPQPSRLSGNPSAPWSHNSANTLQTRDTNQQHVFNSSGCMIHKPKDTAIKQQDTWSHSANALQIGTTDQQHASNSSGFMMHMTNNDKVVQQEQTTLTWSQVAAKDPRQSCSSVMDIDDPITTPQPSLDVPASTTTATMDHHARESRYITDSLAFISSGVNNDQNMSVIRPYAVLKIKNISWNVSASDVYDALSRYKTLKLPDVKKLSQCIHILMDVKTGKTLNNAYVELEINATSSTQVDSIVRSINIPQAQGRHISICRSSYDELCNDLFSGWRGQFTNGIANPHTDSRDSSVIQKSQYYIGQKDLQRLLNVCRFYKTYYNRKCGERPFEYLITIIMSMPWKQPRAVTTAQRDIIYECYKLAIEALYKHVSRPYHSFDEILLPRMVRAAVVCDGFTVKQKKVVLTNANMDCPEDLASYMQEPPMLNSSGLNAFLR